MKNDPKKAREFIPPIKARIRVFQVVELKPGKPFAPNEGLFINLAQLTPKQYAAVATVLNDQAITPTVCRLSEIDWADFGRGPD